MLNSPLQNRVMTEICKILRFLLNSHDDYKERLNIDY